MLRQPLEYNPHGLQDVRFPSFPRRRESSKPMKSLDTRLRGYDEFVGLEKVLSLIAHEQADEEYCRAENLKNREFLIYAATSNFRSARSLTKVSSASTMNGSNWVPLRSRI